MAAEERLIFPVGFDLDSGVKDASEDWKRIQKQMQAAIDSRPISVKIDSREMDKFKTFVDRTYASVEKLQSLFPEVFKASEEGEGLTEQFQAMETSINAVNAEMRNLENVWNNLSMEEKFDKDGKLTTKAQEIKRAYVELYQSQKTQGQTLAEITKEAIALANKQIEQAQRKKAAEEEMLRLLNLEETTLANIKAKQSAWMSKLSTTEIGSEDWKNAVAEVQRLDTQIKKLQNTIKGTKGKTKIDIDTSTFAGKLKDLENRWKALTAAQRKGAEGEALRNEWRQLSAEAGNYTSTLRSAVTAQDQLSNSQAKSVKAIKAQNVEYGRQMGYIERLITRLGLYTGIYAAAGMIRNIRETTAEFELQEVALGAIVQDAHAAAELFSQIKAAAVESPYQIKDLVTYTKQLAAYGFEQNELFDTTMRLADISAGLGADMSRIILAVGQISAATVLKGTELRQLTELGIPMVELLADKFTQLRGEVVSAGEVFDMISDKAVSFKMVEEILNDLTNAGGMFYDMQRKQADTLAGQWSNLKDTIAIAYDEIGNTDTVRNAMEGVISLLKGMADNWERTASILGGLAVGVGTYVAAIKSAALVETLRNQTLKEQMRLAVASYTSMPKWIAAIIGETRAKKVNLTLTKALRVARLKEIAATNVATKAFWKLTAAMLSNPYAIAIAAIGALVATVWNLSKNTKTAEETVDDLNKSVASLSKLNNSVKPLIDEFDALSSKTEKTTQEQKRLDQVTKELANRYPAAISAVKEYGKEVDITAGKIRELYLAETEAAKKGTEAQLAENEKLLTEQKSRYDKLVTAISRGTKIMTSAGGMFGGGVSYEVAMTDEEIAALKKEMDELGLSIQNTESAIKAAKIALGLLPSEAQEGIDAFGAWKKELEGFLLSYKTFDGQDIQFFDDEQIRNFKTLNDALAETVKIRKENVAAVEEYNEILKSTSISEDTRERIKQEKNNAQAHIDTADAIIKHFNAYSQLYKKDRTPLQLLNEEVSLLEKVYNKYKEYRKYMSDEQAKAKTQEYFADTIDTLRFGAAFDSRTLEKLLRQYQAAAKRLPDSKKAVMEIGFKADDVAWQDLLEDTKKRVSELADAVSRSKEARDFYDKMLGMTGDRQLSADLTMSVYGGVGDDLKENIKRQLMEAFKGVDISSAFDGDNVDYKKLEALIPKLPEDLRSNARKLVEDGIKDNAKWLQDLYKTYEEFKTYEQRRTTIMEREAQKRREIEANTTLTRKQKDEQLAASRNREAQQLDTIDLEEFKASEDWIQTFENIDKVGTKSIEHLMVVLKEFIETNKDLTPEQIKTLMTEYEKLYQGLVARNPLKAITEGTKEYFLALKELRQAKNSEGLKEAEEEEKAAQKKVKAARKDVRQADTDEDRAAASLRLAQAEERLAKAEDKRSKAEGKVRKAQDKQRAALNKVQDGVNEAATAYNALNDVVSGVMETFNIDETSELGVVLKSVAQALTMVAGVLGVINAMITLIETHPLVLAISAGIMSIIGAIMLFQNLKTANSERIIKEQEKLLEDLEYQYKKLEEAAESAFGTEYLDNYQDRLENLYSTMSAYEKQAQAERDKGKQADEDAIKDYENSARDTMDSINEMQKEVSEKMLGTDLGSAARDFADAWLEAYKEFGNTADAIGAKFSEMIENMVAESVIAGVMKTALQPVFDMIDKMTADDLYDPKFWQDLGGEVEKATENADVGAANAMKMLEAMGINIREMGSDLTGISKDIATASEESILGLAAGINTQNFYISQIHAAVLRMEMLMQSGSIGVNIQDLVTMQNQHLAHLPNIADNTANTLAECKAILVQVTAIADNLNRVITANGSPSTHQLHTTLS